MRHEIPRLAVPTPSKGRDHAVDGHRSEKAWLISAVAMVAGTAAQKLGQTRGRRVIGARNLTPSSKEDARFTSMFIVNAHVAAKVRANNKQARLLPAFSFRSIDGTPPKGVRARRMSVARRRTASAE